MLEIRRLNQFYGGSHILWDVDMSIAAGSCTCLMGRNGMGKTTLLRCIMGLLPATGDLIYDGHDLGRLAADRRAGLGIGYVPQGREIFSQLTVEENLRIGLSARRNKSRHDASKSPTGDDASKSPTGDDASKSPTGDDASKSPTGGIPERIFELFPVLKKMLRRRGGDLSGGQQQQLAIGRALVLEPRLLILDEPTEGIQPNIVHEIGDIILRLNQEANLTVLLVEQKLPFARRVANEFRILDKGRIVAGGKIPQLTDELVRQHLTV